MTAIRWCPGRCTATACFSSAPASTRRSCWRSGPTASGDVTDTHVAWTWREERPQFAVAAAAGRRAVHGFRRRDTHLSRRQERRRNTGTRTPRRHYSASPIAADGKIYFLSEDGVGVVVKADRDKFRAGREEPLDEKTLASYGVLDGDLLIRTETSCIASAHGRVRSQTGVWERGASVAR